MKRLATKLAAKKTPAVSAKAVKRDSFGGLSKGLLKQMYEHMMKARILEERLIQIYKNGEAYFWIGSPGEEAFGVPLGMLAKQGKGNDYDWMHLHYRCTPTLVAYGMSSLDSIRLIMNRATDPCSGGRNFSSHYCFPEWNVAPVSSPIGIQYGIALGTAHAQKRDKAKGITIVTGGDAGTAEGDFATSLIWSSRKGNELPMLITVQNNKWGISTSYDGQHGEETIAHRAMAFGMPAKVINGNDPIESYFELKEMMDYVRKNKKPAFIEANVSRLYGHSSASGANFVGTEIDCVSEFEKRLIDNKIISPDEAKTIRENFFNEAKAAAEQARSEPAPTPESIWDHTYTNNENADWRSF